ncbi:MAG: hypothetical protein U0802_15985 [Candidatus Binatia bacterium]
MVVVLLTLLVANTTTITSWTVGRRPVVVLPADRARRQRDGAQLRRVRRRPRGLAQAIEQLPRHERRRPS